MQDGFDVGAGELLDGGGVLLALAVGEAVPVPEPDALGDGVTDGVGVGVGGGVGVGQIGFTATVRVIVVDGL